MNLTKVKVMASKVLGAGKNKIIFDTDRLDEISEAITKQDIRDLYSDGAISLRPNTGRKKSERRTTRRGPGKIHVKVGKGKREYIILTRKFRRYIKEIKNQNKIGVEEYKNLRKRIKARAFKNKAHLKEHMNIGVKAK